MSIYSTKVKPSTKYKNTKQEKQAQQYDFSNTSALLVLTYLFICVCTFCSFRRKRSSNNKVFTSDMVHILPGYPKQSPDDPLITLLAFYLQLPQGFSENFVDKDVLKDIVESDVSSIGGSIGGTISSVQPFPLTDTPTTDDENDEESKPTSVIIGASVGGALLLVLIGLFVLSYKKSRR